VTAVAPERLASLLAPRSVALIGATDRSMWSRYTFQNLRAFSPDVPVHCVHPRHEVVHGQPAHRSIGAIGQPVDLAYVMVPTGEVVRVLEEAADAGVRSAVVLTAGFGEVGPEGRALEDRVVALARERDMVLLGPNGNGFINAADQVAPYGLPITPPLQRGPLGIVLQSGGLASVVLHMAASRNIGVSRLVATGNEAMVTATDVLAYLVADERTTAIAAFLESIREPERFRELANAALAAGKPIVVLKVGRSAAGQEAALAHTGAIVGDVAVTRAALRQIGVVQVDSLDDLLTTAGLLAYERRPLGRRLAAVTASGGACDLIADRATDEGMVSPMRTGGVELLVSVRRDLTWGLVLAVGLGGLWVEVLEDTALRLLPVAVEDVEEALGEQRGAALLRGARGRPPVPARRVAEVALAIAGVAEGLGEDLDTLEVNPLWAAGDRVEVLDALAVWRAEEG
jgi:acyl-CoA synthetase (NDP forming)